MSGMLRYMTDRFIDGIYNLYGKNVIKKFRIKVVFSCRSAAYVLQRGAVAAKLNRNKPAFGTLIAKALFKHG